MSRSKRRGDNTAPALFPFLAVLLCTIGALVLILVITVTNSHATAKRTVVEAMADIHDTSELIEVISEEFEAEGWGNLMLCVFERKNDEVRYTTIN